MQKKFNDHLNFIAYKMVELYHDADETEEVLAQCDENTRKACYLLNYVLPYYNEQYQVFLSWFMSYISHDYLSYHANPRKRPRPV